MSFEPKTDWKDGDLLPASDINRIEQGVADASKPISYDEITDRPKLLEIGKTEETAKAGNYIPPDVTRAKNGLMLFTDKVKLDGLSETTPVPAPTIKIDEPADAEQTQAEMQKIIDAIKSTGLFT